MSEQQPGRAPGGTKPAPAVSRRDTPFGIGVPLGHFAGVPIRAHWSVLVAVALFAGILATGTLPATRPGETVAAYWVTGVLTATLFFITLLLHELAHAVTARHYRMRVQRITLWMLGGLTELDGEPPTPRADALVAASGPLTSLGLGAVFGLLDLLVQHSGLPGAALAWLALTNVLLGVFNLLPGAPLDGGRLLRALFWWQSHDRARAAERAASAGRLLGRILIGLGLFEMLLGAYLGIWLALVGWFILSGAASEAYAVRTERLRGLTVGEVMTPTPTVAPDWWTVQQFVQHLPPEHAAQPVYPLVDLNGGLGGATTIAALDRVPPDQRADTRMRDIAQNRDTLLVVSPDTALPDLLLSLHLRGGLAVVAEGGHPVGVVTDEDLVRAAQLADLGWPGRGAEGPGAL
jgi:Zn-dependent protease